MKMLRVLIKRNIKLFFKDKGMFFTSLITPVILLVLYATFLGNVYRDSFLMSIPAGLMLEEKIIDGYVGGQLISSILAVSCVTVAFCSNMLMVQDRANASAMDFTVSPVKSRILSLAYFFGSLFSTFIICLLAMGLCLCYVASTGWFLSLSDVLFLLLDILLLTLFGTALSSVIHFFLSTQGQISAVGSIVSSTYGFICGAYMPISQFSEGLQTVISFLPGTYGTSLVRNHAMRGVFLEMERAGLPNETLEILKDTIDCNLYFFDRKVPLGVMYAVLVGAVVLFLGIYILLNYLRAKKK